MDKIFEHNLPQKWENGELQIQEVEQFTYLGVQITKDKVQASIKKANKSSWVLQGKINSKSIAIKLKITIYKTIIRPIMLYANEVQTLKERKCNRSMEKQSIYFIF